MDSSLSEAARNAIDEIVSSDETLNATTLAELSGLKRAEIAYFNKEWQKVANDRRKQIIGRLVEMAEENIEYNFDAIFRICLKDPDEEVRYMAVEGLWENEETSLIDPLIDLLENDESEKVQAAAAMALGKFAIMAEFEKLRPETSSRVREALLGAIDDRNKAFEVTRRVLESAAPLSVPEVHEAIMEAWESNNFDLKISALFAMGKSCDSSWLPLLIEQMASDDPEIRYEAATACGELEDDAAVPALVKLAEDEDIDVRMAAIQALGKIGTPEAKECILVCLKSSNDAVRESAEEAVEMMKASDDPASFLM